MPLQSMLQGGPRRRSRLSVAGPSPQKKELQANQEVPKESLSDELFDLNTRPSPTSIMYANLSERSTNGFIDMHPRARPAALGRPSAFQHPSGVPTAPRRHRVHRYSLVLPAAEGNLSPDTNLKPSNSQPIPGSSRSSSTGGFLQHLQRVTSSTQAVYCNAAQTSRSASHASIQQQLQVAYRSMPYDLSDRSSSLDTLPQSHAESMSWIEDSGRRMGLGSGGVGVGQQQPFMLEPCRTSSTELGSLCYSKGLPLPVIPDSSQPNSPKPSETEVSVHPTDEEEDTTMGASLEGTALQPAAADAPEVAVQQQQQCSTRFSVTDALQQFTKQYEARSRGSTESNSRPASNTGVNKFRMSGQGNSLSESSDFNPGQSVSRSTLPTTLQPAAACQASKSVFAVQQAGGTAQLHDDHSAQQYVQDQPTGAVFLEGTSVTAPNKNVVSGGYPEDVLGSRRSISFSHGAVLGPKPVVAANTRADSQHTVPQVSAEQLSALLRPPVPQQSAALVGGSFGGLGSSASHVEPVHLPRGSTAGSVEVCVSRRASRGSTCSTGVRVGGWRRYSMSGRAPMIARPPPAPAMNAAPVFAGLTVTALLMLFQSMLLIWLLVLLKHLIASINLGRSAG